jgi:hypothetical protein
MTRAIAVVSLSISVALTVAVSAQSRPDLSGVWRPAPGVAASPGDPFELNITQTPDSITIRTPTQVPEEVVLKFDGTESHTSVPVRGGSTEIGVKASWDGPRLVVSSTIVAGGQTVTGRQTYALDGDRLIVETTRTAPDGTPMPPRTSTLARVVVRPLAAPPARPVEAGFTSLFNGKDLTGWQASADPSSFSVQNGAIVAHDVGQPSHLFYEGPVGDHSFRNFELRLDATARYRSNGGVYLMTAFQAQGFPNKGFEIQVNNSHTDRIRTGSLYHVVDLSYVPAQDDEWFPMVMKVEGNTITIAVKGQEVVHWVQPPDWAGSYDFSDRRIAPGTIALQAHDPYSVTAYANIRIRPLP